MPPEHQQPQPLNYAATPPSRPTRTPTFDKTILALAALPAATLAAYHLAVALSPWTLEQLCIAADSCTPISPAATWLTETGATLHCAAFFLSPPLGLLAFLLGFRALSKHRTHTAILAGAITIACILSTFIGVSHALNLSGF